MNRRICAAMTVAVFAVFLAQPASAQATADKLAGGASSLASGNYSAAVTQLTKALASPDIELAQTAHAMYQRGIAYRKLGQSARAIADLSGALWLPALPAGDKARAHANRALAYKAVGMNAQAESDIATVRKLAPAEFERLMADKGNDAGKAASSVVTASRKPVGEEEQPADGQREAAASEQPKSASPPARPGRPGGAQSLPGVSVMGYMTQQQAAQSEAPADPAGDEQVAEAAPQEPAAQEQPAQQQPAPQPDRNAGGNSYPGVAVSLSPDSSPAPQAEEAAPAGQAETQPEQSAAVETQPAGEPAPPQAAEPPSQPDAPQSIAPPSLRSTIPDPQAAETAPPPTRSAASSGSQRAQTPAWQTSVDDQTTSSTLPSEPEKKSGNRVMRFFNSLVDRATGKGDEEAADKSDGARMASTNWNGQTKVVKANATQGVGAEGTYRLQLGSSRSDDEARKLWRRISAENSDLLAGQEPQIEKTDLGSLGTVWRLNIGPFNDKAESLKLCNAFKRSGVDCFLVTR